MQIKTQIVIAFLFFFLNATWFNNSSFENLENKTRIFLQLFHSSAQINKQTFYLTLLMCLTKTLMQTPNPI